MLVLYYHRLGFIRPTSETLNLFEFLQEKKNHSVGRGSERSRTGHRKKLNRDAATVKIETSDNTTRSSRAEI